MIYSRCAVCGASVYRYERNEPRPGDMGNAEQDCWHVHANPRVPEHLPRWTIPSCLAEALELDTFTRGADGLLRAGPGKYEGLRPFEVWLATNVLGDDSWSEEQTGDSVSGPAWHARTGRYIVTEDSSGFVYVHRSPSVEQAELSIRELAEQWDTDDETDDEAAELAETREYRHARYVRDADEATARAFAQWATESADTGGPGPFAELSDAWTAWLRATRPRGTDGH